MDLHEVIIRPLITEKSTHQSQHAYDRHGGAYSFEVHATANKAQIKDAIEKLYGVSVVSVRTSRREKPGHRFRLIRGNARRMKKAVVVLSKEHHIDLF